MVLSSYSGSCRLVWLTTSTKLWSTYHNISQDFIQSSVTPLWYSKISHLCNIHLSQKIESMFLDSIRSKERNKINRGVGSERETRFKSSSPTFSICLSLDLQVASSWKQNPRESDASWGQRIYSLTVNIPSPLLMQWCIYTALWVLIQQEIMKNLVGHLKWAKDCMDDWIW